MSAYHQIFVHTDAPADVLLSDLARACGTELTPGDGEPVDYSTSLEHAAVELELEHDFEEDFGIPFERYEKVVTIRDHDRDTGRQEMTPCRLFAELAATQRHALLLVFNLQELLDAAPTLDRYEGTAASGHEMRRLIG